MPMNIASIGILLCPVVGVISGALVLGEPIGSSEILALALIGSALALVLMVPAARTEPAAAA
jgi:drug/metabolite transporter (DMT)-like permease